MNELKCLEHPTLKVPYEVFNKRYRNAQRVLDVEARQVASASGEIDTATKNTAVTTGEIDTLLGGMVEKLTTMKRKASEAINEELQAAYVCKKRLEHLKEQATVLNEPSTPQTRTSMNQWRKVRLDRMLVDYFLRNGYYESANKLADARSLRELTNVDIYAAAAEVEAELCQQRTARCLQWCADNKSKLRKLNSSMEFKIRIQEFIELVREDKRLEAVRYAKKHFSTYEEGQLEDIQHCMGMLAFPKDTEVQPYRSLLAEGRETYVQQWTNMVAQFRWEHARLLHPARLPALPVALQLGLAALNTPYPFQYACEDTSRMGHILSTRGVSSVFNIVERCPPLLPRRILKLVAKHASMEFLSKTSIISYSVTTCSEELFSLIPPSPFLQKTTPVGLRRHRLTVVTHFFVVLLPAHVSPPSNNLGSFKMAVVAVYNYYTRYLCVWTLSPLNISTKVSACPVCQPPLNRLARALPHAHCSHSRLVCRITNQPLNEHNQPMVLPNGQVYGEKAIKEMVKLGSIVCPKTKEVFSLKSVEKVYVM
ncbi:hypothetical protein evm_002630 [Chilo suppressalis]|nr:hypothetical protein evm_002630 [Chilo suppressalis]